MSVTIDLTQYKMHEVNYKLDDKTLAKIEESIQNKIDKRYKELTEELSVFNEVLEYKPADLILQNNEIKEYFYEFYKENEERKLKVKVTFNKNIIPKNIKKTKKEGQQGEKKSATESLEKYNSFLQYQKNILKTNLHKEAALKVINFLLNSIFYLNDKIIFINKKNGTYSKFNDSDVKNLVQKMCSDFNLFFSDEKEKIRYLIDYSDLITYIKIHNTFENIRFENDVFAKKSDVKIDRVRKEIVFVRNHLIVRRPESVDIADFEKEKIINDYKQHWGENYLTDFIDYIVAVRFAQDRKLSYLNLNAPSNWGKSFLMGVCEELYISTEVRVSDLREDKASGLSVNSVLNSFVLFIDEFKKFTNVLFKYTHNIIIEEKFRQAVKVPSYAKILLNADESESFSYAVDEQIKNRVLVMKIKSNTKLDDRELYKKNSYVYKQVVKEYFYEEITKRIENYKRLGKIESVAEAERKLRELKEKYKIESDFNVDDLIRETIAQFLVEMKNKNEDNYNNFENKIKDKIIFVDNNIYIKSAIKTILNILKEELDEAEFKKVEYKKAQFEKILNAENKVFKINGKTIRAFKLNLNALQFFLLNKNEQDEILRDNEDIINGNEIVDISDDDSPIPF